MIVTTIKMLLDSSQQISKKELEEIISHVIKVERSEIYFRLNDSISQSQLKQISYIIKRRESCEPLPYILGTVDFYHCEFIVDSSVLIPRPETEILVDLVVQEIQRYSEPLDVLDLCCGSGCIGISLKKAAPQTNVYSSDVSSSGLQIAKKNALHNDVDIIFSKGDLLQPFVNKKFDIIVCNPPYISIREYQKLDRSVKDFEPKKALVGGEDGLLFYQRLSNELPSSLKSGSQVFMEIGYNQGESVKQIFNQKHWKKATYKKDWSGNDRFFFLEYQ